MSKQITNSRHSYHKYKGTQTRSTGDNPFRLKQTSVDNKYWRNEHRTQNENDALSSDCEDYFQSSKIRQYQNYNNGDIPLQQAGQEIVSPMFKQINIERGNRRSRNRGQQNKNKSNYSNVGDRNRNERSSLSEVEERLREIELVMGFENENLREHKEYLLKTITKMQLKQKEYKKQIVEIKNQNKKLHHENTILKQKYEKARDFIAAGIGKIEEVISIEPTQTQPSNNTVENSNENSINIAQQIQQLSDKFDVLMYEYQKTKEPEVRRRCMEIAKQLRKLRKMQSSDSGKG